MTKTKIPFTTRIIGNETAKTLAEFSDANNAIAALKSMKLFKFNDTSIRTQKKEIPRVPTLKASKYYYGTSTRGRNYFSSANSEAVGKTLGWKDIRLTYESEPYLLQAIDKFLTDIFKRGYSVSSKNPQKEQYIKARLEELSYTSYHSFNRIIELLAVDLLLYGNAFLVLKRTPGKSSVTADYKLFNKVYSPITSLDILCPADTTIEYNAKGYPQKFVYSDNTYASERKTYTYSKNDVIHFSTRNRSGDPFGFSFVSPALDDCKTLRVLEDYLLNQAFLFSEPIIHGVVGSKDEPYSADLNNQSATAIESLDAILSTIVQNRIVVTDHRQEIKYITPDKVYDLNAAIEYFKNRVITGLGLSGMDLGDDEGASRDSGKTLQELRQDKSEKIQKDLADVVNTELILHLIAETDMLGGEPVNIVFPPINTQEERSRQNHALGLFQGNVITINECRFKIGYEPVPKDGFYDDLFGSNNSAELTASKNQPVNQHGKSDSKPKINKK